MMVIKRSCFKELRYANKFAGGNTFGCVATCELLETLVMEDKSTNMENQQLDEELYKPTARKSEKGKLHSSLNDNIWGSDLADLQINIK